LSCRSIRQGEKLLGLLHEMANQIDVYGRVRMMMMLLLRMRMRMRVGMREDDNVS
jgi:hypothetical protein